jgi:hypothetical protein
VLEFIAFYACDFDVLRIETTLPIGDILDSMDNCTVRAMKCRRDHPCTKTIDGVLFTNDGKTLLAYPDMADGYPLRRARRVERIEGIHNEYLQTVSLPIGLQSIGDYGFSGCVRLQSIALPLTVKEIGKEVFSACVSLELVSLPEGLEAEKDERGYWEEYYPDDALFRGDNGDTLGGERRAAGSACRPGAERGKRIREPVRNRGREKSGHSAAGKQDRGHGAVSKRQSGSEGTPDQPNAGVGQAGRHGVYAPGNAVFLCRRSAEGDHGGLVEPPAL